MAPRVQAVQRRTGLLGAILAVLEWIHSISVRPVVNFYNYSVLGAVEESISSLIRESLALVQRSINGFSAWLLSVFQRDYKQQLRGRWQELAELHQWWRDDKKHSTLNAVLARRYGDSADGGLQSYGSAPGQLPHSRISSSGSVVRRRLAGDTAHVPPAVGASAAGPASSSRFVPRKAVSDSGGGGKPAATAANVPAAGTKQAAAAGKATAAGDEIQPYDEDEDNEQQNLHQQRWGEGHEEDADEQEGIQWWQQGAALLPGNAPAWLAAMSEEAQEAAAAAQEAASAATAAVQQAASSVSTAAQQAVEEAAAAAAALARNMRAVFEQQPAGWSVDEAIRGRTGLLEDVSLFSQLLVMRVFDAIRWVIGLLTLTPTPPTAARAAAGPRWSALRQAAASGTASPRASNSGGAGSLSRTSSSGFAGSSRIPGSTTVGRRVAAPSAAAAGSSDAVGVRPAAAPGAAGMLNSVLLWPWGGGAPAAAAGNGAAAYGTAAQRGNAGAVRSPTAAAAWRRRSATSIDLPRMARLWPSDSEDEGDDDRASTGSEAFAELEGEPSTATEASTTDDTAATAAAGEAGAEAVPAGADTRAAAVSPGKQPLKPALSVSSVGSGVLRGSWTGGASPTAASAGFERNRAAAVLTGVNRVAFAGAAEVSDGEAADRASSSTRGARGSAAGDAAGDDHGQQVLVPPAAVVTGRSPFASERVQEKHHSAISKDEWQKQQQQRLREAVPQDGTLHRKQHPHDKQQRRQRERQKQREAARRLSHGSSGASSAGGTAGSNGRLQRSHSGPAVSELRDVSSAGQVIRMAGYPLEVHEVLTADGYLLRMERIPQHGSTDVVFMMHGVLDTSLTWVAGGITGSQAFAAWDRGFDVWLGSSRSNPPHAAADPRRHGSAYWCYTHNEVGLYDMGAQIDHIHTTKMRELAALGLASGSIGRSSAGTSHPGAAASSSGTPRAQRTPRVSSSQPLPGTPRGGALRSMLGSTAARSSLPSDEPAEAPLAAAADQTAGSSEPLAASAAEDADAVAAAEALAAELLPAEQEEAADLFPESVALNLNLPLMHAASTAATDLSGSGRGSGTLGRAESAAESDAAAAAEASVALVRYRAAAAAAGFSQPAESAGSTGASISSSNSRGGSGAIAEAAERFWSQLKGARLQGLAQRRRGGSLDLDSAAATAAAAAASAAATAAAAVSSGMMAAASGAIGAAAAVAAAATAAVSGASVGGSTPEQQDEGHASESPCSSSSVACTVHITPSASGLSADASQQCVADDGPAGASAGAAISSVGLAVLQKLSSSGSMRHVLSAPDMGALTGSSNGSRSNSCNAPSGDNAELTSSNQEQQQEQEPQQPHSEHSSSLLCQQDCQPHAATTAAAPPTAAPAGAAAGALDNTDPQQPTAAKQQQQQQPNQQQQEQYQQPGPPPPPQQQQQQGLLSPRASRAMSNASSGGLAGEPYNLRVVCHSLGGFMVLIYCIHRQREGRPHRVKRLILLSPAGFHPIIPRVFKPVVYLWRPLVWYMRFVWQQKAFPVHLPTFVARMLAFKLTIDTSRLPAVGDLVRSLARLLLGGDRSAWDRALLMPHYTAAGMPLLSSFQVMHFCQLYATKRCQLYDYGSTAANVAAYQQPTPPVISERYHALRGVPVHLVAGLHDGVIPPSNIQCHYEAMKAAGVDVSYREFEYGHMDFTFSAKEELGYYISGLLMRK